MFLSCLLCINTTGIGLELNTFFYAGNILRSGHGRKKVSEKLANVQTSEVLQKATLKSTSKSLAPWKKILELMGVLSLIYCNRMLERCSIFESVVAFTGQEMHCGNLVVIS